MKSVLVSLLVIFSITQSFGQKEMPRISSISLSGGHMSFGTGDILGYSLSVEGLTQLNKRSSNRANKLLIGGELFFENGARSATTSSPAPGVIEWTTFRHTSGSVLWSKLAYYPLQRF
ncbi:MAG: hypothetical protein ABI151_11675, partial [Chitinophagaceae bacterium]